MVIWVDCLANSAASDENGDNGANDEYDAAKNGGEDDPPHTALELVH